MSNAVTHDFGVLGCVSDSIPCCSGCCCTCGTDFPFPCECHDDLPDPIGDDMGAAQDALSWERQRPTP